MKKATISIILEINHARVENITNLLTYSSENILTRVLPKNEENEVYKQLNESLDLDHVARLLPFPEGVDLHDLAIPNEVEIRGDIPCRTEVANVCSWLKNLGFGNLIAFPSTIVAKRLNRHPRIEKDYHGEGVPMTIVKGRKNGGGIELFIVNALNPAESREEIETDEEMHYAFRLRNENAGRERIEEVRQLWFQAGFNPDGGGINEKERFSENVTGVTVLYFKRTDKEGKSYRVEVMLPGIHEDV